jgi:hypothetical protein
MRVERPGRETDDLTSSIAEFKSECRYTSTTPYTFLDLAVTGNSPSQNTLLLIDFLKSAFLQSWVGALSVFSADEDLSAAKVFAKLCRDAVNTMNVVSCTGTLATAGAVQVSGIVSKI